MNCSIVLKQSSLDNMHHNFIGSFENGMHSEISEESLNRVLFEISITSMHLEGIVDYVKASICSDLLSHRTVHSVVGRFIIKQASGMSHHQS